MTRKEKKRCHSCGVDSGGKYHCETCRKNHNARNQKRRDARKSVGLCPECGDKAEPNMRMCESCQTKSRTKLSSRISARRKAGKCVIGSCTNLRLPNKNWCKSCNGNIRAKTKSRSLVLINQGLCATCGKESHMSIYGDQRPDIVTRQCQTCYLKLTSCGRFGSVRYWGILLDILESQGYCCAYTGEKLILGVNDSIDHILPRSRYPGLTFDMTNIQWTTRIINTMKLNLLDCEFLTEIEKIAKHLGDDLFNRATAKTHPPQTRQSKIYHRMH